MMLCGSLHQQEMDMQGVLVNFVLKYIDQVETYEGVGTKIILQQKYWDPFKICLSLYF